MNTKLNWKPVIESLLNTMHDNYYSLIYVDNGLIYIDNDEELVNVYTLDAGVDLINATDESTVHFKNENGTEIRLYVVLGNSPCETVCDYSIPRDENEAKKLIKVMEDWSDSWEGRECPVEGYETKDQIIVEVRGGIAYCDDPRVKIVDYDNE